MALCRGLLFGSSRSQNLSTTHTTMTTDIDDIYGITTIEIRQHAKRVVQHANKTGAIERQELTLSAARALVAKSMGLDDDALDAPEEKKACKEAVLAEIVS